MFQGNPTRAVKREQEKKEKQDELGVCRIRRREENQSSETLGSGFVVKDLQIVQAINCQYCLISSNKVFPNGCNIKSYYLDFKKLNKQNLKTIELDDIAISTKINRNLYSGLVVIPISPSKRYNEKDSIFTYRPFKVGKEERKPNQVWRCHFVDDGQPIFSVKQSKLRQSETNPPQYQLVEAVDCYKTYAEVTHKGDRKPYGGAILKNDNNEYVVVGAMTFTDDDRQDISPVFFQHSSEDTVDVGATGNETAQQPTPAANSYDHHHDDEQIVPDPDNAVEVVNPNPSNEAARYEDTVPGPEHHKQERNAAVAGRTESPNLNQKATVSAAAATQKESLQPEETNAESLTINPIQEGVENTVDAGATGNETAQQPTAAANSYVHHLVTDQLVSEVVTNNSLFLEKLSKYLDRESRWFMCWRQLAYVMDVPPEERNQFDLYTEHSPTEDLFNYLCDIWNQDLKVIELKAKLKLIHRNDVIADIEKGGFKDARKVSDLISGDPKFIKLLSPKLDVKSRGNWRSLAEEFGIRKQKTEQFGLRGSGPTGALFSYMRTANGLRDLTMEQLRSHFFEMDRKDLLNLLDKQNIQGSRLVKDVLVDGSELLSNIGERLNKEISAFTNWRNLAHRLEISPETYLSFDTSKEKAKSPTKMMFQWLAKCKPDLNIDDLLKGIRKINRIDVTEIVTKEAEAALEKLKQQCAFVDGSTEQHTANQALHDLQQMHQNADQSSINSFNFDSNLRKNASDKGFRVSGNPGEGDCMFYALSEQLEFAKGIQRSAAELRQEIVQYLQQNPKLPDGTDLVNFTHGYPSWSSYLEKMAKKGTWSDHVILLAAAYHFNTPIRVISSLPDHEDIIINPQSQVCNGADTLVLGHVHEEHYVSLLPLTGKAWYTDQYSR